jgi:alpha-glucosidase
LTDSTLGALRAFTRDDRSVILDCGGPRLSLAALTPRLFRVRLAPQGNFAPRRSWAVARADGDFPPIPFEVHQTAGALDCRTEAVTLRVARDPVRMTFVDAAGREFCADGAGPRWSARGVGCDKRIEDGEHFYGFGERMGPLDKLGRQMHNWTTDPAHGHGPGTDPMYIAIPVFVSVRPGLAYGMFFNNTWRTRFDMGRWQPGLWSMEAEGGELDYYVAYGPSPEAVLEGFGELLGTMPLPPRWALGYHQSRWSYKTEAEVRRLIKEFQARDLPCDVIHFDIDYMRGYRVFTWDPERFPNPAALLADLRREGFRTIAIIDPGVKADPDYVVYQQGLERDCFIRRADGEVFHGHVWPDDSVFSDYTRPEVRAWWGDLQKALVDAGVSGIWNDMNEPTVFARPFSEGHSPAGTLPPDAVQGLADERTTHAEVHNLYGSGMARASYEGLRRLLSGERPFVLTRSAFAGVQRWSACWMGDNHSWWEHLEMSLPQLLNMGLSGAPFVGVDIGGFNDNASGELFARWMQLGVLYPFCRGHSSAGTQPHEPWAFGPRVEAVCRDYLKLRYRLLPYLYSLFWEASRRGVPLLRPLLYHFPDDAKAYTLHDQAMLGPFVMAAPIYRPGQEQRAVYLPEGVWYDWWTGQELAGPAHLLAHAPLEKLPLYVRAGAILPSGPEMNFADEKPLDPLTLDLYPGAGAFTLYEDDGHTFEYERGQFCVTTYRLSRTDSAITFEIGPREGAYTPAPRRVNLRLHAIDEPALDDHPGAHYAPGPRVLSLWLDDDGRARILKFRFR